MAKKKNGFFAEFKAFITRGNIVDMAIGVIIAGAFTKIVTAFTNDILMPIINWVFFLLGAKDSLLITILNGEDYLLADGTLNEACIYINWSALIEACLNFILIALVLFIIIKIINGIHKSIDASKAKLHEKEALEEAKKAEEAARIQAEEEKVAAAAKAVADAKKAKESDTNELLVEIINLLQK